MDSIKGKTTLDRLSGRQWRFAKKPNPRMSKWQRWYFTDSLWATVNFVYDEFKRVWNASIKTHPYYLSDFEHKNFSTSHLDKKYEGGRFINFYRDVKRKIKMPNPRVSLGGRRIYTPRSVYMTVPERLSFAYEICFLTEWVLVYSPTGGSRVYRYTMVSD